MKITTLICIAIFSLVLSGCSLKPPKWNFIGYQYKWSKDYVEKKDIETEEACIRFGENWLEKQKNDALFTCSLNCKADDTFPGAEVCKKVCEYGKQGFIRCRE